MKTTNSAFFVLFLKSCFWNKILITRQILNWKDYNASHFELKENNASGFELKTSVILDFRSKNQTRQILIQKFYNVSDFEFKILQSVRFWTEEKFNASHFDSGGTTRLNFEFKNTKGQILKLKNTTRQILNRKFPTRRIFKWENTTPQILKLNLLTFIDIYWYLFEFK